MAIPPVPKTDPVTLASARVSFYDQKADGERPAIWLSEFGRKNGGIPEGFEIGDRDSMITKKA
jgi:hypothetical protein